MLPIFFQKIICCPHCQKELVISQESLHCLSCQKSYPLIKGIPIFENTDLNQCQPLDNVPAENPFRYALHFWLYKKYLWQYLKPQANDVILDIGCGLGHCLDFLSKFSKNLVGLDTDLPPLLFAKTASQADYVLGRGEKMPFFKDNTFNKIISFVVLEHIEDDRAAIQEMRRVGKNKATALIMVPALEGPRVRSKERKLLHKNGGGKHFRDGYYQEEIKDLLNDGGIRVLAIRHTMFICSELFMEFSRIVYSKKYKTYSRQTDWFKICNGKLFSLYKILSPLIGSLALLEDWLFSWSKKGHMIVVKGEIQK